MANLVLAIAFLEANATQAVNMLCDGAGLPRSEPNAKIALKRLAVREIERVKVAQALAAAEAEALIE